MAQEIEAKIRVESHDPIRERLRALGAACDGCVLEQNWIYDLPDGSLRDRDVGLRLRRAIDEDGEERSATMTVKGPVSSGEFKSREEVETRIDNTATAARMLELLGFVMILSYQKRRESWLLEDCRVELDEPPHVGLFVEIEGPTEAAIRKVQSDLGLAGAAHVRSSYVAMMWEYCRREGVAPPIVRMPGASDVPK